jgi:predicted nucleic acid-binding Zn ribbon protein
VEDQAMAQLDDDESSMDESEFPDESDMDRDDGDDDDTEPCPYCGQAVYAQAQRCPRCGRYISAEDRPRGKPLWIVATAVVCLIIVVIWVIFWH